MNQYIPFDFSYIFISSEDVDKYDFTLSCNIIKTEDYPDSSQQDEWIENEKLYYNGNFKKEYESYLSDKISDYSYNEHFVTYKNITNESGYLVAAQTGISSYVIFLTNDNYNDIFTSNNTNPMFDSIKTISSYINSNYNNISNNFKFEFNTILDSDLDFPFNLFDYMNDRIEETTLSSYNCLNPPTHSICVLNELSSDLLTSIENTVKDYSSLNVYSFYSLNNELKNDGNFTSSGYVYDSTSNSWKNSEKSCSIEFNNSISSWILKKDSIIIKDDGSIDDNDGYFYLKNSSNLEVPYIEETSASFNYYSSEQSEITSAYWTKFGTPDEFDFSSASSLFVTPNEMSFSITININTNIDDTYDIDYPDLEDLFD